MYSHYQILITELWRNENQSEHPVIIVHNTPSNFSGYVWLVECLQRELPIHFTACVPSNSSTGMNTTFISWCILPNKTCNLGYLGETLDFIKISYQRELPKSGYNFPWHIHCLSYSYTYDSRVLHLPYERYQWQVYSHYGLHLLSGYNLDANKRKEIALSIKNQTTNSGQSCSTATHWNNYCNCHRHKTYKEHKNINFNECFHITLHSYFLQAPILLQSKRECYDSWNLQGLNSNADLVMRHTNNVLVISNSVAPHINTLTNGFTERHHITFTECASSRNNFHFTYSAIPFSHSLNVCKCTLHFLYLEFRNYIPFRSTRNTYILNHMH
jgi:hypothetical protein